MEEKSSYNDAHGESSPKVLRNIICRISLLYFSERRVKSGGSHSSRSLDQGKKSWGSVLWLRLIFCVTEQMGSCYFCRAKVRRRLLLK